MQGWLFGKLKWLLLIAAVGGPALAFFCWQDGERRKEVMAHGVDATASIEGATRTKGRRSGTSYKIDLSWTDAQGGRRTAKDVSVSTEYADRIIVDNKIAVDSTRIRYIADGAETPNLIVTDDETHQEEADRIMIYVGAGAGIVGLLGSGLIFSRSRRQQPQPA